MTEPSAEYLAATDFIDADDADIRCRASEIVVGACSGVEKMQRLFCFVRDAVSYYPYTAKYRPDDFRASLTLRRGRGYCVQKAVLLAALCRARGIPARLRFVTLNNRRDSGGLRRLLGSDLLVYHGYNDLYINGCWVAADAALSQEVCAQSGFTPLEFDGVTDADYRAQNRDERHYDLVTDHGAYADLPFTEIMDALDRGYGNDPAAAFKRPPGNGSRRSDTPKDSRENQLAV